MSVTVFAPPPLHLKSLSSAPRICSQTAARRARHYLPCPQHHCCLTSSQIPSRTTPAPDIAARFRLLGAEEAADQALVVLSSVQQVDPSLSNCAEVLDVFAALQVRGVALSRLVRRLGILPVLRLDANRVKALLLYLADYLQFGEAHRNRVISRRPNIFDCPQPISKAVEALEQTGLRLKDVQQVVLKWPGLLLLDAARINRAVTFLQSQQVGFSRLHLKSLIRRAPWILVYEIDREMAPAVLFLRDAMMVEDFSPVDHFIRASPLLLGTPRSSMQEVIYFLMDRLGLNKHSMISVIRSFPPLLTCSVEHDLAPVANFLSEEVMLHSVDLARTIRAFPALLTLDVENDMRVIVNFFKDRGVQNVARIVGRLPAILGYDLDTNIRPKMDYVEKDLGLSSFDILQFPGYFSYSLETRIQPRTQFLLAKRLSITQPGLNHIISPTDEEFCFRVAYAPLSQYHVFRKKWVEKMKRVKPLNRGPRLSQSLSPRQSGETTEIFGRSALSATAWKQATPPASSLRKKRFKAKLSRLPWKELR